MNRRTAAARPEGAPPSEMNVIDTCCGPVCERQALWPAGKTPRRQAGQFAAMTDESRAPGFDPATRPEPYIDWFVPPPAEKRNGVCAVLVSGGAYNEVCDVEPVTQWRERFEALGCVCASVVYRVPRPRGAPFWQSGRTDLERALRLVRSQAAARGFDPGRIVVVAQSAGAHAALMLATGSLTRAYEPVDAADAVPSRPDAVVAFAPAYAMSDGQGCRNVRGGDGPDVTLSPVFEFDARTCPACMLHGGADPYSPLGSTHLYRRFRAAGVPAEVHLYADKGHGGYGLERGVEFLRQLGMFGPVGPEERLLDRFPADVPGTDGEPEIPLWPEGAMPDPHEGQCEPWLRWYVPKKLSTRAVQVIWAGGAYNGNATDDFEVAPARRYLNSLGMAVVAVHYRTPRPPAPDAKHVSAWQDARRAIRLVRSQAAAHGLDPDRIGVMGSSAGGHLALMCATSSRHEAYAPVDETDSLSAAVQWAVCIYPAYVLWPNVPGTENVPDGGNDLRMRLGPEFSFDPDTPPMVFVHGDSDGWPATASVAVWEQLRRMGIQGDLHTLALRDHCFHRTSSPGTGSYTHLERISDFLRAKGFLP